MSFSAALFRTVSLCALATAAPALAQSAGTGSETAAAPQATDAVGIGDIVVTAEKRVTRIEKTPVTVNVVQSEFLAARGPSIELQKLAANVPGLVINDGSQGLVAVSLRGIGTASANQMFEQSIGLFIDGLYNPKPIQYRSGLLDAQRIEVIKGGQGVIFGESTSVGAISILSNTPTQLVEGSLNARYEPRYKSWDLTGVLNTPINDDVAVRVAGAVARQGGYVKFATLNDRGPEDRRWTLRGTVSYRPNDQLKVIIKAEATSLNTDGDSQVLTNRVATPATLATLGIGPESRYVSYAGDQACGTSCGQYIAGTTLDYTRVNPPVTAYVRAQNGLINLVYDFDNGISLTSLTGIQHFRYASTNDPDQTPISIFTQTFRERFKQITQEVRLASPDDARLSWMVGVFGLDQHDDFNLHYDVQNFRFGTGLVNGTSTTMMETHTQGLAAFGQARYKISPELSVTGGLRYSHKERKGEFLRVTTPIGAGPNAITTMFTPGAAPTLGKIKNSFVDATAGLSYQATPSLLTYATFSHGSKPGAFNIARASGRPAPVPFTVRKQVANTYEAGFKWRGDGGKAYLGISAFYLDIKDFQDAFYDGQRLAFVVGNIDAKSKGIEAEARYSFTSNASLSASYNYTHARLADGSVMQRAPAHSLAGSGHFAVDLQSDAQLFVDPTITWSTGFYTQSPSAAGVNRTKGRTNVDLRAGVKLANGIEFSVLAENLTSSKDLMFSYFNPLGLGTDSFYNRPRTFTFGVRVPFGN